MLVLLKRVFFMFKVLIILMLNLQFTRYIKSLSNYLFSILIAYI